MPQYICLILFAFTSILHNKLSAQSQDSLAKNTVYAEALGNGGNYSVNYERFLTRHFSLRVGIGSVTERTFAGPDAKISGPIMINFLMGKKSSKLELGVGVLAGKISSEFPERDNKAFSYPTGLLGYRYQNPKGGILLRAGTMPFYIPKEKTGGPKKGPYLGFGVSLGYAF